MFQKFDLDAEFGPSLVAGELIRTLKHETVTGAYTYEFKVPKGTLLFTVSRGFLQEVSYRYPSIFPWVRAKYCRGLLEAYAQDEGWTLVYKDKSGKMYHSGDERYYAAVCKSGRFVNIGSMIFHEEKFRIVS